MALKVYTKVLTDSLQTFYTVGSGLESSVHGLVFSNNTSTPVSFDLTIYRAVEAVTYTLANDFVVAGNKNYAWPKPINMGAGDYLQAVCSSSTNMTVTASVYENSATVAVGFTPQGSWNSGATYLINDVVTYQGIAYVSIQNSNTNNTPAPGVTAYWQQLATTKSVGKSFTFGGTGVPETGTDMAPYIRVMNAMTCESAALVAKTAPSGGNFVVSILKSSDGGATFPTTVSTITVASGAKVGTASPTTALAVGDLLRLDITSVNGAADWNCHLYANA
jgi:hypothetical protein